MSYLIAAIRFEVRLYVALARWIARRPDIPAGTTAWGYSQMVTPVMWLWIFASAMELPLVHVLVPWEALRISLLIVGVWGLAWMIGMLASYRVYPHLADADGLRVRLGKRADVAVPWRQVAAIRVDDRDLDSTIRTFQPRTTDAGIDLQIGVSARANVHLTLAEPLVVPVKGEQLEITALTFLVDDPRAFVAAAQRELSNR
jgi:hypothetical protein